MSVISCAVCSKEGPLGTGNDCLNVKTVNGRLIALCIPHLRRYNKDKDDRIETIRKQHREEEWRMIKQFDYNWIANAKRKVGRADAKDDS